MIGTRARLAACVLGMASINLSLWGTSAGARQQESPKVAPSRAAQTEATRRIAHLFLTRLFDRHDIHGAYETYAAPDFIQHNPEMTDGTAGHRAFFEAIEKAAGRPVERANVNNILLVDGDLFALHHHMFTGADDSGRVFVDIWRVADGRIVEHWDVIEPRPPGKLPHDNGLGCGKGEDFATAREMESPVLQPACGLPLRRQMREHSLAILDRYTSGLLSGGVRKAITDWLSDDYRQHSANIADGREGAIAYLENEFGPDAPRPIMGEMRVVAEGDFVLIHRLTERPATGEHTANVDIFRITGDKISEHWDLAQPIPEDSANSNGMW